MITADLATIIDRLEVEFVKLLCRVLNYWLQLVFNSFSHSSAVPSSFSFCTGSCIHPPSALHRYTSSAYSTVDPNSLLLYSTQLCPQSFLSVSFCSMQSPLHTRHVPSYPIFGNHVLVRQLWNKVGGAQKPRIQELGMELRKEIWELKSASRRLK
ncbi:hypothetical protein KQX54_006173 [Cotesia glomerata]|uniref:Uncharacterized protein n=1 Tax=Cotesia glomerata TaxID=32391 RepID=A0AAV7I5G6_COTGL|nr:hypothetical protein KQX54_006173 [Cotesia glomerata]